MEAYAPTCNLDVKTCSSRSEAAHLNALQEIKADGDAGVDEQHDNNKPQLLQKKKSSNAVHVVVVINEKEINPHSFNIGSYKRIAECRICQEEEELAHLDNPCACSGTLMYAHPKCVQRWCDEKGDTTCEICQQPFKSGYTASPQSHLNIGTFMDFSDQVEVDADEEVEGYSSNLVVVAAAQRRFLDGEYEEANSSGAACCRSAALLLMVLLLLRHAIAVADTTSTLHEEDTSMLFSLFLLRAAGFLLPCYIMVRAINMLQRHYREDVTLDSSMHNMHATTTEMAIILQAGRLQA